MNNLSSTEIVNTTSKTTANFYNNSTSFNKRSASTFLFWNNWRDKQLELALNNVQKRQVKINKSICHPKFMCEGVTKERTSGSPNKTTLQK